MGEMYTFVEVGDASPEALLDAYAARGWGDGLPLVAPTPERVERMLAFGAGDPDQSLANALRVGGCSGGRHHRAFDRAALIRSRAC